MCFYLKRIFNLLFISILFFALPVCAQQAQDYFGKNRIQYKEFDWKYISTFNFDIYYYQGGKELAKAAANFAEIDFQQIVEKTGFTPYSKIKILIYNTATELQQSNIGLDDEPLIGGQTNFVKSKLEVAYKGTYSGLRKDIRYGIAEMIINVMLYGGSLKDVVQSSYLLALPDWYVSGAAAFIAEGWSTEMDNYMRDMFSRKKFKKPAMLPGKDATIAGQSIWNYIEEKYGRGNLANILNLTRIVRNEEASIESSLGVSYHSFIREWRSYYIQMAAPLKETYVSPEEDLRIRKNRKGYSIRNVRISPDGKWISFVRSYKGKYKLLGYNIEKHKIKRIDKGGHKLLNQQEDPFVIVSAWKGPSLIAYVENRRNKLFLVFEDLKSGKRSKRYLKDFSQVHSFSFSKDGDVAVISGSKDGQSDIFLYNVSDNALKQLTNDIYDDVFPAFLGEGYSVVFSSDRLSDTLNKEAGNYKGIQSQYNLFIYNTLGKNTAILQRLTEYGHNFRPVVLNNDEILFLSDEKGLNNIYRYTLKNQQAYQVSNYVIGPEDFDYNDGNLAFIALHNGKEIVYFKKGFSLSSDFQLLPLTDRQRKRDQLHPRKKMLKELIPEDTLSNPDTDMDIDINSFQFESDVKKKKNSVNGIFFKPSKEASKNEVNTKGPFKYRNLFGIERVNSTIMIDPLRGLGVLLEAEMADMMGNHRMNAGLFGLSDLKSSSVFGEYQYLKKRIDYKLKFDRKTFYAYDEVRIHRYTLNRFIATASYPLTESQRISLSPFIAATRFTDLSQYGIDSMDVNLGYGGLRAEYVFDNTHSTGLNMIQGTRGKIIAENYVSGNSKNNFGKIVIDFRHYQKIHRDLIFATRASFGQFFGNAKKNFLLGGMDNWLLNSNYQHSGYNPLSLANGQNSNLLFVEYVTNMRGFQYNTQFGSKYILLNAELRLPVFKYFYRGVINSNFLKNFQIVGFTDVGSAWSGKTPFSTENSTNTKFVGSPGSPFYAKVVNYKSPFLVGYGTGLRTLFLGYYVKFDVGWGMVDNKVVGRRFYLTFGYDF